MNSYSWRFHFDVGLLLTRFLIHLFITFQAMLWYYIMDCLLDYIFSSTSSKVLGTQTLFLLLPQLFFCLIYIYLLLPLQTNLPGVFTSLTANTLLLNTVYTCLFLQSISANLTPTQGLTSHMDFTCLLPEHFLPSLKPGHEIH